MKFRKIKFETDENFEKAKLAATFFFDKKKTANDYHKAQLDQIALVPELVREYYKYHTFEHFEDRWYEAEPIIFQDPDLAIDYFCKFYEDFDYCDECETSHDIDALEEIILTVPNYARWFAQVVIEGKYEPAERAILKSPFQSYLYCAEVLNYRWLPAEKVIAKSACNSYQYAKKFKNDFPSRRFELGEKSILKDPWYAVFYAKEILNGRWSEAETEILNGKYDFPILDYAIDVLKARWPEGEDRLKKSHYHWNKYIEHFNLSE